MNRRILLSGIVLFALVYTVGCSFIENMGNPFVGKWVSGALNLELKGDKTFELAIGKTVSVNLEGYYDYDKDKQTLTLDMEDDNKVTFLYEFKDGSNLLALTPDSEFRYINSKIEFTRE